MIIKIISGKCREDMKTITDWTNKLCDICNVGFDYYDNGIHRIKTMSIRKGILYCPSCIKER